ncbi:MAG: NAD-dependent epimerase/dehydratase family protein [Candidatus Aminicenantales bacterium]
MKVIITGGAGYVGSFTARMLADRGHQVAVVDNLDSGHIQSIDRKWLVRGSFGNAPLMRKLIREYQIEAVMHFGASTGERIIKKLMAWAMPLSAISMRPAAVETAGTARITIRKHI